MPTTANKWDEYTQRASSRSNRWATSDRGWLWSPNPNAFCLGSYLDYGPNHYRSPHEYCREGKCCCRESQPGNIHCVAHDQHGNTYASTYVETVEQARKWIEEQAAQHRFRFMFGYWTDEYTGERQPAHTYDRALFGLGFAGGAVHADDCPGCAWYEKHAAEIEVAAR